MRLVWFIVRLVGKGDCMGYWVTDSNGKRVWVDRYYESSGLSDTSGWRSQRRRSWDRRQKKRGRHTVLGQLFRGGKKYRGV